MLEVYRPDERGVLPATTAGLLRIVRSALPLRVDPWLAKWLVKNVSDTFNSVCGHKIRIVDSDFLAEGTGECLPALLDPLRPPERTCTPSR
jgi:hypothetical protein